ncbi:MAG: NAD-dependent epimerase/dehydratase family protein [Candidatus Competibacteraceae bacterium]|nr:NAD-dependent epimerase/dehydratase family protein [Candidatus Competibacteraceae bacterium]
MQGKKVLVTGGAGFIGSHIIDLLIDEGCTEIVAVDNMVRGRPENLADALACGPVRLLEGDIRDRRLMADLVANTDLVFHQAALRITQCAEQPREALEVMVDATYDLLELCVQYKVEKIVAASSASVYGMADHFPITESHHPYNNRTLYGAAKVFNEGLLRSFHDMYGLNYIALRYFNVYGLRMDIHGVYTEVLIRWMERIAVGEPPLIFGPGDQTMDFINIRDVARANILAAKADVTDEVFNIASGTETSLNQLADALLTVMESSLRPEYRPERKVNPVQKRLAGTAKALGMLGFDATVTLEDGLRELVTWWQEQQALT